MFRFVTFVLQYMTYIVQLVLSLFKEPKSKYSHIGDSEVSVWVDMSLTHPHTLTPLQRRPCPEADATFLSRITWWWQNGQIWYGWRHPLKYEDLADLNMEDKSAVVAPLFQKHWDQEIKKTSILR